MNWGIVRFKDMNNKKIVIIQKYITNRIFEVVCLIFLFVLFFINFEDKSAWMLIAGVVLFFSLILDYPLRIRITMDDNRNLFIEKRYPLFIPLKKSIYINNSAYIKERLIGINIFSSTGRNYGAYIQYKDKNSDKTSKSVPIFFSFEFGKSLKTNCLTEDEIMKIGEFLGLRVDVSKLI